MAIKKARAFVKRALANRNSKNLFEKYGKLSREVESETEVSERALTKTRIFAISALPICSVSNN